jgi:hypothetical protein
VACYQVGQLAGEQVVLTEVEPGLGQRLQRGQTLLVEGPEHCPAAFVSRPSVDGKGPGQAGSSPNNVAEANLAAVGLHARRAVEIAQHQTEASPPPDRLAPYAHDPRKALPCHRTTL